MTTYLLLLHKSTFPPHNSKLEVSNSYENICEIGFSGRIFQGKGLKFESHLFLFQIIV